MNMTTCDEPLQVHDCDCDGICLVIIGRLGQHVRLVIVSFGNPTIVLTDREAFENLHRTSTAA